MRTYYKEKLLSTTSQTYNSLTDKPSINGFELVGNASAENLGTYNKQTIDRLAEDAGNLVIDSALPTPPAANTLYYIGNVPPFEVYLSDADSNVAFLGLSSSQNFQTSSEGIKVITSEGKSIIMTNHDSSFRTLSNKALSARLIDMAPNGGLSLLPFDQVVGVNLDTPHGIQTRQDLRLVTGITHGSSTGSHYEGQMMLDCEITPSTVIKVKVQVPSLIAEIPRHILCSPLDDGQEQFSLVLQCHDLVPGTITERSVEFGVKMGEYGTYHFAAGENFLVNKTYDIEYGNNYLKVNGEEIGRWAPEVIHENTKLRLFKQDDFCKMDILRLSVYNGNTLINDFIPAIKTSGYIGLYDLLSDKFISSGGFLTWTNQAYNVLDRVPSNAYLDSMLSYKEDVTGEITSGTIIETHRGLVPAPSAGSQNALLRDDGVWDIISSDYLIGEIRSFAGNIVPDGWLLCDGSVVSKEKYRRLYNIIGNTFNGQSNANTQPVLGDDEFMLPDLRQRFVKMATPSKNNLGKAELPMAPAVKYTVSTKGIEFIQPHGTVSGGIELGYVSTMPDSHWTNAIYGAQNTFSLDLSAMGDVYKEDVHTVQPSSVVVQYIIKC